MCCETLFWGSKTHLLIFYQTIVLCIYQQVENPFSTTYERLYVLYAWNVIILLLNPENQHKVILLLNPEN